MPSLVKLKSELGTLNREWEKLHSKLIKAEANHDESEVINLLSQILAVAKKQSKVKQAIDEIK